MLARPHMGRLCCKASQALEGKIMVSDPFENMPVIQPGGTPDAIGGSGLVTRQVGLDPKRQQLPFDPMPPTEIVQGGLPEMVTTRQVGLASARFGLDGTYYADSVKDDTTTYADQPFFAAGDANPPPAAAAPVADVPRDSFDVAPAVVQPMGDVVASDNPAPGE